MSNVTPADLANVIKTLERLRVHGIGEDMLGFKLSGDGAAMYQRVEQHLDETLRRLREPAIDNGGQAFPTPDVYHSGGQVEYGALGMTLRDYFMAHAPAEPQDWFTAAMPTECPKRDYLNKQQLTVEELSEYEYFHEYFPSVKAIDLKTETVRNYAERALVTIAAERQWNAENAKQRYIQWPAAWADEMLKARAA